MKKALFGLARSEDQALSIANQLKGAGFADNDISVLSRDTMGIRHFGYLQRARTLEGTGAGAGVGILIGAAMGWMLSIGTLVIAGVGPFVAAPIMVAFAGAGLGAAAGGLIGALIGTGMHKYEVRQYDEKMKGGNILIAAYTKSRLERDRVKEIFKHAGAVTAAEAVVDHAYGRPSGAVGVAMTPTPAMPEVSNNTNSLEPSRQAT